MKLKSFEVGFSSFALTIFLLYLVGSIFTIPMLMFHFEWTISANGFYISLASLLPLIIGLVISFIAEQIYRNKYRQKLG